LKISDAYKYKSDIFFCGWRLKYSISTCTQNTIPVSGTAPCSSRKEDLIG